MYSDYNSVPTGIEQGTKSKEQVRKVFENGHIYILLPDGRKVNAVGATLK